MRKLLFGTVAAALAAGLLLTPGKAQAWWRGGISFGPPVVIAPPVVVAPPIYAPPPVVYAPAPVYAPPPAYSAPACYAGPYVCPLDRPAPINGSCTCATNNGRVFGLVH